MKTLLAVSVTVSACSVFSSTRLGAQTASIAGRVDEVRNGVVLMHFAAKPGVCGSERGSIWTRGSSSDSWTSRGSCITGPIRVAIGRADNSTVSVRVSIGDDRRAVGGGGDLGTVSAPDAARYLLEIARGLRGKNASEAVSAAALADSVNLAPEFTALVRDDAVPIDTRQQALFWLGQTPLATTELLRVYDRLAPFALRESFVYVISQRRDDAAVDKLIDIAGHDVDHEIRKRAMYWLGQTNNPRAVTFLRDIITR